MTSPGRPSTPSRSYIPSWAQPAQRPSGNFHHQAQAHRFLYRADQAIAIRPDHVSAFGSLRRAATHVITALAVHQGWPISHKSRRQLGIALHANIASANLSYSHLTTLRQVHTPPHACAVPTRPSGAEPLHSSGRASEPALELRRLRRRVASLAKDVNAVIAGKGCPPPVHYHKLWQRKPDLPDLPQLTSVQQILALPNFSEIRQKFRLAGVGMDTDPDPHGFYSARRPAPALPVPRRPLGQDARPQPHHPVSTLAIRPRKNLPHPPAQPSHPPRPVLIHASADHTYNPPTPATKRLWSCIIRPSFSSPPEHARRPKEHCYGYFRAGIYRPSHSIRSRD